MVLKIIMVAIEALLGQLNKDLVKKFVDGGLDKIEDAIAASETQVDDTIVLPLINHIRNIFDIPDNDE